MSVMQPWCRNNICLHQRNSQRIQCWSKLDFETFSLLLNLFAEFIQRYENLAQYEID